MLAADCWTSWRPWVALLMPERKELRLVMKARITVSRWFVPKKNNDLFIIVTHFFYNKFYNKVTTASAVKVSLCV